MGELENWYGYNGWKFDPQRCRTSSYEDGRFKGYQDGSAIGLWGIPELPLLNGRDRDAREVVPIEKMVVLSKRKLSAFKNFVTGDSDDAKWSQSCTETRVNPNLVNTVLFRNGIESWHNKEHDRSCVRPVVTLELKHLIL
jgi:hypothetical protein